MIESTNAIGLRTCLWAHNFESRFGNVANVVSVPRGIDVVIENTLRSKYFGKITRKSVAFYTTIRNECVWQTDRPAQASETVT